MGIKGVGSTGNKNLTQKSLAPTKHHIIASNLIWVLFYKIKTIEMFSNLLMEILIKTCLGEDRRKFIQLDETQKRVKE